jgi:glycosyltransferase involved in cell wall biosynthesis
MKARVRHGLTWLKMRSYVRRLLQDFDGCTVVSRQEHARVRQVAPDYHNVEIIPNGIDLAGYHGDHGVPEPDTIVYAGSLTYSANFDAVRYFLEEIYPLIQRARPSVKFSVTGKLDGVPVDSLPRYDGVTFTGYLNDVRPAVARSWVSVVPLRQGGGTRLKILESLALRTPVVSTTKGAEGLDLVDGRDLLIADAPADFAAAVLRMLDDSALRERLRTNGRREVAAKYDWHAIGQNLCGFAERMAGAPALDLDGARESEGAR